LRIFVKDIVKIVFHVWSNASRLFFFKT